MSAGEVVVATEPAIRPEALAAVIVGAIFRHRRRRLAKLYGTPTHR